MENNKNKEAHDGLSNFQDAAAREYVKTIHKSIDNFEKFAKIMEPIFYLVVMGFITLIYFIIK